MSQTIMERVAEAKRLASFVKRHRIDELAPVPHLADDGISYYYLHLTPERGWRLAPIGRSSPAIRDWVSAPPSPD